MHSINNSSTIALPEAERQRFAERMVQHMDLQIRALVQGEGALTKPLDPISVDDILTRMINILLES